MEVQEAVERVRLWIESLQASPWAARLRELRVVVRESFGQDDLEDALSRGIAYLKVLRSDYAAFVRNPADGELNCGSGSQCDLFRGRMLGTVTDLRTILQVLSKLDDVQIPFELRPDVVTKLIQATPKSGLFLMSRFENVFPLWESHTKQLASLLVELFPDPPASGLTQPAALEMIRSGSPEQKCRPVLARPVVVNLAGLLLKYLETGFLIAGNTCPVDSVVGVTVAVGARLTLTPSPCRATMSSIGKKLTLLGEGFSKYIADCQSGVFQTHFSYENNVDQCNQLPGLYLPGALGGTLEEVRSLVQLRLSQMQQGNFEIGPASLFLAESELASQQNLSRQAFACLCESYKQLKAPSPITGREERCRPTYRWEQTAYVAKNDDGDELGATKKAEENSPWSQLKLTKFRLRVAVRELWGNSMNNVKLPLQYREVVNGFPLEWRDVDDKRTAVVRPALSDHLDDGQDTTQQISNFVYISDNNGVDERDGSVMLNFEGADGAEAEFSLFLSVHATPSSRILFRVTIGGSPDEVFYGQVPEMRIP